jgi:hypothetical protein
VTRHGLPIGISFFGKPYTEPRLIALAYAFEQGTKALKPPSKTPPLDWFAVPVRNTLGDCMDLHKFGTVLISTSFVLVLAAPAAAEDSEIELLKRQIEQLQKRVDELEAERRRDVEEQAPVVRQPQERDEQLEKEIDDLRQLFEIFESDQRRFNFNHRRRLEQLRKQEPTEIKAEKAELEVDLGGAVWINFAHQNWVGDDQGRKDDLRFDNLRLSMDSTYGNFLASAQYRFYSYSRALHHAWIGYQFAEDNQIEVGVSQVPFGILPFASHNFWFMIPYYVGLEDDYDAGVKWHHGFADDWTLDLAFYLNEEYDDATDLDRYSVDVVRDGDQQNDERNQFNLRLAYDWNFSEEAHTEFGISGRYGALDNRTTQQTSNYWAAAIHANAFFGPWNLMLEGMRYVYDPENPVGVSDDLVLMGNLGSKRLVAAEADILVANIAHDFGAVWGPIERLNCYNDYSYMRKDESSFKDSQINDTGCLVAMGPFWVWIDYILGKNAWYLNDSETNSGFGPGGTNDWEQRFNVNFEWYF